jgi:TRAP transporter 4TM/12TM fusion protein
VSGEPAGRNRQLSKPIGSIVRVMAVLVVLLGALYALEIHALFGLAIFPQQFLGLMLALILPIIFLTAPSSAKQDRRSLPWYDAALACAGMVTGLYVTIFYPQLAYRIPFPSADKYIFGTIGVLLVLEASRRYYGPLLVCITIGFILYARFASFFPGVLKTRGIPWAKLSGQLYLSSNGMFGLPMEIMATVVLVFVLFGAIMFAAGGGALFSDIATAALGRFRGGPAKVAVLGSCLFGTISGSAIANVAVVGTVTIPLMKRLGYRAEIAAAIEATASTGGIIMPPVMGALSFLIAEFLQIPYRQVIIAAAIPALLYYGALLVQVDLEAARLGLKGLPSEQIPKLRTVLSKGWPFFIPLVILLFTLLILYWQPAKAGMAATLFVVFLAFYFVKGQSLTWWFEVLAKAGQSVAEVVIIGALIGLIIACCDFTGLGLSLSMALLQVGQVNLLLFLVVTAVISLILGMGLPGIAIYIMQTALIVPALVQMGIMPLAAHFFIMYFATFSMITPPVALAAIAAAGIAKADPWKTGWEAVRLGIIGFIVPFMFVLSPSLLFQGDAWRIFINAGTAGAGVLAIGIGLRGFFFTEVGLFGRALLILSAVSLILPVDVFELAWAVNGTGFVIAAIIITRNYLGRRRSCQPALSQV